MKPIIKLAKSFSLKSRQKRANIFKKYFVINKETKILDLGSWDGSHINMVLKNTLVQPKNVYIADINEKAISVGESLYGFKGVVIKESGSLPFGDKFFDIVYCSSVIEHVTVPKKDVWKCISEQEFKMKALKSQKKFAKEIQRVGKQYFVQTPYKYFPIETHTWLPLMSIFPRYVIVNLIKLTNTFWIKKTLPDWCLLTKRELKFLFPDAEIIEERVLGIIKSIMAIKSLF